MWQLAASRSGHNACCHPYIRARQAEGAQPFLRMAATHSCISSRFFLPRLCVPSLFFASLSALLKVEAEPILISSIMRFSYGEKPMTSRVTSRISFTRLLARPLRLAGLSGTSRRVTMNPRFSPAARPVLSGFGFLLKSSVFPMLNRDHLFEHTAMTRVDYPERNGLS